MAAKKLSFVHFSFPEFVFAVLLIFSGAMLAFSSGSFVINLQEVGFSVFTSMQKGLHAVTSGVSNTLNAVHELSQLREENALLVEKLKNYEQMQRSNTEIRKENERLKEQLHFSAQLEQKNYVAQIIGRDPEQLYSAITINKGSRNGIKKNMPVVAVQNGTLGLVGKIVSVGAFTSQIMPVYDIKCSVSARIENTRDIGLLSGLGSSELPMAMRYIKKRVLDELHFGDIIVTSGETENYMRDIPIGSISKITVLDYDSSLNIEVTPIIDFARLETVIVTDLNTLNPLYNGKVE